ncbi:MAG: prepilin peptidase, partial [Chloroflexota bacterium]|nr:prepilin peptidase [Chloroflexota bacterium]
MLTAASPYVVAGLGLAGLLVGRLLNLAIDRLPEGGRLGGAWPRCSGCGRPLPPVIHVPVVGFTVLRGRCPLCGASLSWRTPVVEFLAGALFAYVGYRWGISAVGLVALLYISILLVTAAIDMERQLILNSIVYPAALVALALAPWGPPGQDANGWRAYLSALEGGALAFG